MRKTTIVPSILERSVAGTRARLTSLAVLHVPVHLDLMDGIFVRGRSIGPQQFKQLTIPRGTTAHLMVTRPDAWAGACWNAGIRSLVLHVESSISPTLVRELARYFNITIAINPGTPLSRLRPFHTSLKRLHIMTVHPGRQGAPFLSTQLQVLKRFHRQHPRVRISVDGGMNERTIPLAVHAGARSVIVGSALKLRTGIRARYRALLAAAA